MTDKIRQISKDTVLPVTISVLIAMFLGVWKLADAVNTFTARLGAVEQQIAIMERRTEARWTWQMEEAAWRHYVETGEVPDLDKIRKKYGMPFIY